MNRVSIKTNFDEGDEYRLLAMDAAWVTQLKQQSHVVPVLPSKRPREESHEMNAEQNVRSNVAHSPAPSPYVVLVMKGQEQLCASDSAETLLVRRVEYSNTLLIAERRARTEASRADEGSLYATSESLRENSESIVITSLTRLFEAHRGTPQQNIMETLRDSRITVEELEGVASTDDEELADGLQQKPRWWTFQQLAAAHSASPRELVRVLTAVGAVVHQGYVRLLDPPLIYTALRATLAFFAHADPSDVSWSAVESNFCPAAFPRVVIGAVRSVYGAKTASDAAVARAQEGVAGAGGAELLDIHTVVVGLAGSVFESVQAGAVGVQLPHGVRSSSMQFDAFFDAWLDGFPESFFDRGSVPARTAPPEQFLALLSGYVLCLRQRKETYDGATVWWLPRDTLPNDISKRLDVLFAVHDDKYAASMIEPYVAPLLGPEQTFAHLMLRYAREYRVPGEPVTYSRLGS